MQRPCEWKISYTLAETEVATLELLLAEVRNLRAEQERSCKLMDIHLLLSDIHVY